MIEFHLTEDSLPKILQQLCGLDLKPPGHTLTIKKTRKPSSKKQNNLYWKWINEIVKEVALVSGEDNDSIHTFFKHKFLTPETRNVFGMSQEKYSTKELSAKDMSEYMQKIEGWASFMFDISMPHPEDMHRRA